MKKTILGYGVATLFCFVFQLIYRQFSHGVDSTYMTYAFLIPFTGGVLCIIGLALWGKSRTSNSRQLVCGGIIWLTLGCLFKGALEIYGTTNHLTMVFAVLGFLQLIAAFFTFFWKKSV